MVLWVRFGSSTKVHDPICGVAPEAQASYELLRRDALRGGVVCMGFWCDAGPQAQVPPPNGSLSL